MRILSLMTVFLTILVQVHAVVPVSLTQIWEQIGQLQQQQALEVNPSKAQALAEQINQLLDEANALNAVNYDIVAPQEPYAKPVLADINGQELGMQLSGNTLSDPLEERIQKLNTNIQLVLTSYCNKTLLTFQDKIKHDQVSLFLISRLDDLAAYHDLLNAVQGDDAAVITTQINKTCEFIEAYIYWIKSTHAKMVAVFVCCANRGSESVTWSDLHAMTLEFLVHFQELVESMWYDVIEGSWDVDVLETAVFTNDYRANLAYEVLPSLYKSSFLKRLAYGVTPCVQLYLNQLLEFTWYEKFPALCENFTRDMTAVCSALQSYQPVEPAKQLSTLSATVALFEGTKLGCLQQFKDNKKEAQLVRDMLNSSIFALLTLKHELESSTAIQLDYTAAPDKAEAYLGYAQVIKDPLFQAMAQKASFKNGIAQYMHALDLYFTSSECTVEVMYQLYGSMYALTQLRLACSQGAIKKFLYGLHEYQLMIDQMLGVVQKAYLHARTLLLPQQQSFMQKLMGGEWLHADKLKKAIHDSAGKVMIQLGGKWFGQHFDDPESAAFYAASVLAPIAMLAILKYLVPNLPERIQQKVIDFIGIMPQVQSDEKKLAQLIQANPEVVSEFFKKEPALGKVLMTQLQGKVN